jgi:N-acetylglucosaminyldiphosphoundecaprenol N-acetyl-beta-D-mannosaminyltransferase
VTGIELVPMVATAGRKYGLRHFFYGGGPSVAEAAGRRLSQLVPGAKIVGALSPPFGPIGDRELHDLEAAVAETRPDLLWVGLGAPKQELLMARSAGRLQVPVIVGVGAAFDFLAGTKRPAPGWMRHGGLEWLFRLASEPRRLWRRYAIGNTLFAYLLAREALGLPARDGRATEAEE